MKQTIFCTLVFSLFASSCVVTAETSSRAESVQQGTESLAHASQAHSTLQRSHNTRGDETGADSAPQPWKLGDEVAVDPEPQPWHKTGREAGHAGGSDVSVDPEPQPWHEAGHEAGHDGAAAPTTNSTITAATK